MNLNKIPHEMEKKKQQTNEERKKNKNSLMANCIRNISHSFVQFNEFSVQVETMILINLFSFFFFLLFV